MWGHTRTSARRACGRQHRQCTDAREVAAWWATLGPAAAGLLVARFPGRIGALDGVPVHYRDIVNRAVLARDLASVRAEVSAAQSRLDSARQGYTGRQDGPAILAAIDDLAAAEDRRAMLEAIDRELSDTDRHLMVVDTTMPGRAAIAIGDVDTAAHVAVVVPGLNSFVTNYVDKITANAHRVAEVGNEALRTGGSAETVATVAWIGYEAPDATTVASDQHARVGATLLTSTLWGIEANHAVNGASVHLTTVGHSYGSLTSGLAAAGSTPMDDLVMFGSPGVGVDHVNGLSLPAEHVFVGEAKWDFVADLDHFGSDPANPAFGAVPFQTDGGEHPLGGLTQGVTGHSDYYAPRSESLWSITSVVIGDHQAVTVGHTSGAGDFARGAWDGMGGQ